MHNGIKIRLVPMPATKIMMSLAPMMATARGWKVNRDPEVMIRNAHKYIQVASILN